ncbi:sulfonate transport system substrate-binding protein [Marinobacter sp. MBR-105]
MEINIVAKQASLKHRLRTSRRAFIGLLASSALLLTPLGVNAEVEENTLRIGYQKYGTLILLKARGTLEPQLAEQGFDVKWIEFPAGPQLLEGLNVGSVDFGTTGETPPIFAQAAGADLVYVANEPPAPKGEAILVKADSPIQSVADLRGKRVALNKGSNVHYLLVRALEEANLSIRDIKPVYIKPGDARTAFDRGDVDAWVIWDPYQADAEIAGARSLRDGEGLVDNHQIYLASRPFAERYPGIVNEVIDSLAELDAWAKDHPQEVVDILHKETGISKDSLRLAVDRYAYGATRITPRIGAAQQTIADVFYELNLIPREINIDSVLWQSPASVARNAQ